MSSVKNGLKWGRQVASPDTSPLSHPIRRQLRISMSLLSLPLIEQENSLSALATHLRAIRFPLPFLPVTGKQVTAMYIRLRYHRPNLSSEMFRWSHGSTMTAAVSTLLNNEEETNHAKENIHPYISRYGQHLCHDLHCLHQQ